MHNFPIQSSQIPNKSHSIILECEREDMLINEVKYDQEIAIAQYHTRTENHLLHRSDSTTASHNFELNPTKVDDENSSE
jgi:hypothetical protein